MILIGTLLVALLLMDGTQGSNVNGEEVVYGSSFNQQHAVYESQFLHCEITLDIQQELTLAFSLHNFYKDLNVANPISSLSFYHRLRRLQRAYQLPKVESLHPLAAIQNRLLPYLEVPRKPLTARRVTASPNVVTPAQTTDSVTEEQNESSDFEDLFLEFGLGDVPSDPAYNITLPTTTTERSTGQTEATIPILPTTVDSDLRPTLLGLSDRTLERHSQQQEYERRRTLQTPRPFSRRKTLSGQQPVTPIQDGIELQQDLQPTVSLLLQDHLEPRESLGNTTRRKPHNSALPKLGPSREISKNLPILGSSLLARNNRQLGDLFNITRQSLIPTSQSESRGKFSPPEIPILATRSKRSVQTTLLSASSCFIVLASNFSTTWPYDPDNSSIQFKMASRTKFYSPNTNTSGKMGLRNISMATIYRCLKKLSRSGEFGKFCKLHPSRLRCGTEKTITEHYSNSGSAPPTFRESSGKFRGVDTGISAGETGYFHDRFFLSRSYSSSSSEFQEKDSVCTFCNAKCTQFFRSIYIEVQSENGKFRNCKFITPGQKLSGTEQSEDSLLQLHLLITIFHPDHQQIRSDSDKARGKRSTKDNLPFDSTGSFINVRSTGKQLIFGQLASNIRKTTAFRTNRNPTPSGPWGNRVPKLQTYVRKDPLKLTKLLPRLLVRLAKRVMEKKNLNPRLSLAGCLIEATSEVLIYQALSQFLTGLEDISKGKFAQFLPESFLKNLTQKIQSQLDGLPSGHTFRTVNLTELSHKDLTNLPWSIYKKMDKYHADLAIPISKKHFTSYSYDRKSTQIRKGNKLYSLALKPKHNLILTNNDATITLPSDNYLNKHCVRLSGKFYCLKHFLSELTNSDKCLLQIYNDQNCLKTCKGTISPAQILPVETAQNLYTLLSPKPVSVIQICTPPLQDIVTERTGLFNVTLTESCYRVYIQNHVLEYKAPFLACSDENLPCRNFATNLFETKDIENFLNYVDNLSQSIDIQDIPLSHAIFKNPEEMLIPIGVLISLLSLLSVTICVKLFKKQHITQGQNVLPSETPLLPLTRQIVIDHTNSVHKN